MEGLVIITDARTAEMRSAAEYLRALGYEAVIAPETVCLWQEASVRSWAGELRGRLAGVIHPAPPLFQSPLLETSEEEYARARDEGPLAAWCVTKVFGERLKAQGEGSLIYVGSIHAEKPMGYGFLFSADCGATQMLAREVNQDYGPFGVRSFYIQRGPGKNDPDLKSDLSALFCGVSERYPTRRMPEEDALNPLLAFLLTPGAAPLAGSDLRADGGMTMYYGHRISAEKALELQRQARGNKGVNVLGKS